MTKLNELTETLTEKIDNITKKQDKEQTRNNRRKYGPLQPKRQPFPVTAKQALCWSRMATLSMS